MLLKYISFFCSNPDLVSVVKAVVHKSGDEGSLANCKKFIEN